MTAEKSKNRYNPFKRGLSKSYLYGVLIGAMAGGFVAGVIKPYFGFHNGYIQLLLQENGILLSFALDVILAILLFLSVFKVFSKYTNHGQFLEAFFPSILASKLLFEVAVYPFFYPLLFSIVNR